MVCGSSTGELKSERFLHLRGILSGSAFFNRTAASAKQCVQLLREDLEGALQTQIELSLQDLENSGTDMICIMRWLGAEWAPKALSSEGLKKKGEFRIILPKRVFYKFDRDEDCAMFKYCDFQMPHEEAAEVFQRVQEMFLQEPVLEGLEETKGIVKDLGRKKKEKTKAEIKKATIEEKKVEAASMKGVLIVGLAMLVLLAYIYIYLRR